MTQILYPIKCLDDVIAELTDLAELVDVAHDVLMAMDFGVGETRNHQLDKAAALVRIARDMALRTEKGVSSIRRSQSPPMRTSISIMTEGVAHA